MATTIEVLKAARELIADESRWTQDVLARDASGNEVEPDHQSAVCWCVEGAVERAVVIGGEEAARGDRIYHAVMALRDGVPGIGMLTVAGFNDTSEHSDVLDLFDRTIARLEAQP